MRQIAISALLLGAALSISSENLAKTKSYELPRLQGATLLVEGYPPDRLVLTSPDMTVALQEWNARRPIPSISTDGNVVASTRRGEVSTYSVKENKWTDHPELNRELDTVTGRVAISPDGSRLACVTRNPRPDVHDPPHFRLYILDLKNGSAKVIIEPSDLPLNLSWSPDGHRLVFDMGPLDHPLLSDIRAVYVASVESGTISQIGLGQAPSWSPSGEWIAYVGYIEGSDRHQDTNFYGGHYYAITDYQVRLMSPTGTQSRVLMGFDSWVGSMQPVWSPDSRTLLFDRSLDPDKGTFDIYMIDVVTGKAAKKFKNVLPVYGWAVEK
jgi:dipeptidyl aminopeptidase/acylaminoacyl peptidase